MLHRQIQNHWIWTDANKLKWWLDILLTVNNSDARVSVGYEIYDCKRGESLLSIQSWADRWKVSKDTARNFLNMLEKDKMITRVNLVKTTRLSVCNYDSYNTELHVKKTRAVRDTDTNNNDNKDISIISKDIILVGQPSAPTTGTMSFEERCRLFISKFNEIKGLALKKGPGEYQVTGTVRTKLKARLKNYTSTQIIDALKKSFKDPNHIENNFVYITPEFILRENILERYLNAPKTTTDADNVYTAPKNLIPS